MTHTASHQDQLYIGLMCGTSIDGVDVALVNFKNNQFELSDYYLHPVSEEVRQKLIKLCDQITEFNLSNDFHHRIELLGELDFKMGHIFAESVNAFLQRSRYKKEAIIAIGSHGQTIRHQPALNSPFTLQIGDPSIIAHETGITTIADFRRMDMAAGGQGAPLAPAFHQDAMQSESEDRIILNLGGIANITYLPKDLNQPVLGFDTGTANTLLDAHYQIHHRNSKNHFDKDGKFAKQGRVDLKLLKLLMSDPYFSQPAPKSTGREYFSINWLNKNLAIVDHPIAKENVQATLLEFSAKTIADDILSLGLANYSVFASGGGMHNQVLLDAIGNHINQRVQTTNDIGVDGDYLEAMTFAWLAYRRMNNKPGNLPSVTGAKQAKVLGAVYHN